MQDVGVDVGAGFKPALEYGFNPRGKKTSRDIIRTDIVARHRRRSIRLKDYDYSQSGVYFITICTQNRENVFGTIVNSRMQLNLYGKIVKKCWDDLSNHYFNIELDYFIIMPDHVHGIIFLKNDPDNSVGAGFKPAPTKKSKSNRQSLTEVIRGFKTFSARRINEIRNTIGQTIWQRSFFDRIIRNEEELNQKRQYIIDNPLTWHLDRYHSER